MELFFTGMRREKPLPAGFFRRKTAKPPRRAGPDLSKKPPRRRFDSLNRKRSQRTDAQAPLTIVWFSPADSAYLLLFSHF